MKRILYVVLLILPLVFQSCLKDENELFSESAAARMTTALKEYKKTLTSAEHGWALEYYPQKEQSYGGYTYTISFTDSTATVGLDIVGTGTSETSLYQLIGDDGPVLTFDTYNNLIHYFSTPSADLVDGLEGDYEFIILSVTDSEIKLKGKKTGNIMVMRKLTEAPVSYLEKVVNMANEASAPGYTLSVAGKEVGVTIGDRRFTFTYADGEEVVSKSVAFAYTDKGFRFYQEVEIYGEKLYNFELNNDALGLTAVGANAKFTFTYPPVNEQLETTGSQWWFTFNSTALSASLLNILSTANTADQDTWGESLSSMYIGANTLYPANDTNPYTLYIYSTGSEGSYSVCHGLNLKAVSNTEDELNITKTIPGLNWSYYSYFNPILDYLTTNSPYKLEADDVHKPTQIKFVSKANSDAWFVVKLK